VKFRTILPVGAVIIAGTLFAALVAYQAQLYVDIDSHPRERWREGTTHGDWSVSAYREKLYEDFDSYPRGRWREGTTHDDWFVSYDSNPCGRVGMLGPSGVYVADLSRCGRLRATKTRSLQTFSNPLVLEMRFRIMQKTLKDTKIWHTVWVGWHHSGDNRWNNLILKASGWELGKFHPACPKGGSNRNQCYLAASTKPKFADGQWHTARIEQSANADGSQTIRAYGDGRLLASVRDKRHLNRSGHVLLYNEGSVAEFDYVRTRRGKKT
jgi:hypothetical protein